jgi:elongation factor P
VISTSDLKKGSTIELDGKLMTILEYNHIKMGRGSAQVRIKFRDARSGSITEQTFQAGSKWPRARVETREMQYLYNDDQFFYFMNTETYEQIHLSQETLGEQALYLLPESKISVEFYETEPVGIHLPLTVDLKVTDTVPGIKGATAAAQVKPATMETGLVVTVPAFVNEGDIIRINTETGEYESRA